MFPVLFRVGSHVIYAYTVALVAGMLTAIWIAHRMAQSRLASPGVVLDGGFWALLGGILGGRFGYVAANWAYYADHLNSALALRAGGLSWHGALAGGGLALLGWLAIRRWLRPPAPDSRDLLDAVAPALAVGGAWGWLGCLLGGCSYGAEANGYQPPWSWLTAYLSDIYGIQAVRFATQPVMIAWCLLLAVLLWSLRHRMPRGLGFALYLLLYALADFCVMYLRGDGTWRLGLWLAQWAALAEGGLAIGIAVYAWTRPDRKIAQSPPLE
jgi:phosphatidylglycerol---prolipoprotein diacylglyceryl transferase